MKHTWKKAAAGLLALTLAVGAAPLSPVAELLVMPITANAETETVTVKAKDFDFAMKTDGSRVYDGTAIEESDFEIKPNDSATDAEKAAELTTKSISYYAVEFYDEGAAQSGFMKPGTEYHFDDLELLSINFADGSGTTMEGSSQIGQYTFRVSTDGDLYYTDYNSFVGSADYAWVIDQVDDHAVMFLAELGTSETFPNATAVDSAKDAGDYLAVAEVDVKTEDGTDSSFTAYCGFTIEKADLTITPKNQTVEYLTEISPETDTIDGFIDGTLYDSVKKDLNGLLRYQADDSTNLEKFTLSDYQTYGAGDYNILIDPEAKAQFEEYYEQTSFKNYNIVSAPAALTVTPYDLTANAANVEVVLNNQSDIVYDGTEKTVSVDSVKVNVTGSNEAWELDPETGYTVSGTTAATDNGTYNVQINGKGNFKNSCTAEWEIKKSTDTTVKLKKWDGSEVELSNGTNYYDFYDSRTLGEKLILPKLSAETTYKVSVDGEAVDLSTYELPSDYKDHAIKIEYDTHDESFAVDPFNFKLSSTPRYLNFAPVLSAESYEYGEALPTVTDITFSLPTNTAGDYESSIYKPIDADLEELKAALISCYEYNNDTDTFEFSSTKFSQSSVVDRYQVYHADSATLEVTPAPLSANNIKITVKDVPLAASGQTDYSKGVVSVVFTKADGTVETLIEGKDFEFENEYLTGEGAVKPVGSYVITLIGKGHFTGKASTTVRVVDSTLVTGKTYKQTASKDGKYYTRFVFVKSMSDIEGKNKATFTAHYGDKDYTFETSKYYTGIITNGVTYTPDSEDSVLFVVTVSSGSDISADLTCDITFA